MTLARHKTIEQTGGYEQLVWQKITTVSELLGAIENRLLTPEASTVVTLSGPSASGKSTILDRIKQSYNSACTVLSSDDYYIGKTRMQHEMPAGQADNFDHPAAVDTTQLQHDIAELQAGRTILAPIYNMMTSEPLMEKRVVETTPLIIIEGLAANLEEVRELSTLSVSVYAPLTERLQRRIARDILRKGHSAEETTAYFMQVVEPAYAEYYEPSDQKVDFVIEN